MSAPRTSPIVRVEDCGFDRNGTQRSRLILACGCVYRSTFTGTGHRHPELDHRMTCAAPTGHRSPR